MFDLSEKRRLLGYLYSKFTIAVLLIVLGLLSWSVLERYSVERDMAAKRAEKEAELSQLEERAAALEAKVDHLRNERGLEEEIRSRFDVAKEGEQVVILLDSEDAAPTVSAPEDTASAPPPEVRVHRSPLDWLFFWR